MSRPDRQPRPPVRHHAPRSGQERADRVPEDLLTGDDMPPVTSNTSRSAPPANTGSALLDLISNTSTALVHLESRFDPFIRPLFDAVLRDPVARLVTALINLAAAQRRPGDRRGAADSRRRGPPAVDHRQLHHPDEGAVEAGRLRARRQHQDARHAARRVRGARQPARAVPPRRLRRTRPPLPGLGPLLGAGPLRHPRHRGRRLHEHQHQADGRPGSEADGRGAAHPGLRRRLAAHLRHARHQGQRAPAEVERARTRRSSTS